MLALSHDASSGKPTSFLYPVQDDRQLYRHQGGGTDAYPLGKDAGPVGLIWSGGSHTHNWAKQQNNTSFGNIIKMLFIGDRSTIRLANKQQTTYGKRTTTMDERATVHPDIYGQGPLVRHLIDRINYYRTRHNASISAGSSSSSSASTTPLPPNPPADPSSRCRIFSVCVGQLHPHGRPPAATFSLRPHQELTGAGP